MFLAAPSYLLTHSILYTKSNQTFFIGIVVEAVFSKHQTGCEMKYVLLEYFSHDLWERV